MNQNAPSIAKQRGRFWLTVSGAMVMACFLAGCPNGSSHSDTDPQDLALEIGALDTGGAYRKLSGGQALTVVHGAQGGIHVLVSLRVMGFSPGGKLMVSQRGVMNDTGDVVAPEVNVLLTFAAKSDGSNRLDDQRVVLDFSAGSLDGRQATLTFTVSDPKDANLTVSANVVITFVDAIL